MFLAQYDGFADTILRGICIIDVENKCYFLSWNA